MEDLALVLQGQGKHEVAEEMNRRALEGKEKVIRKEHLATLINAWCRTDLLRCLKRRDEAILLYESASTGFLQL